METVDGRQRTVFDWEFARNRPTGIQSTQGMCQRSSIGLSVWQDTSSLGDATLSQSISWRCRIAEKAAVALCGISICPWPPPLGVPVRPVVDDCPGVVMQRYNQVLLEPYLQPHPDAASASYFSAWPPKVAASPSAVLGESKKAFPQGGVSSTGLSVIRTRMSGRLFLEIANLIYVAFLGTDQARRTCARSGD